MITASLIGAACGANDAGVEAWRAQPAGQPGEPPATVGRLQPGPDLSLPVEPPAEGAVADTAAADAPAGPATASSVFPATLPAAPQTPLTFGWIVPCAVSVTEQREFADTTSTLEYTVHLDADAVTGALVMSQSDLRVITANGEVPGPDVVEFVTVGMRIPDVLVGFDGIQTDVRGAAELFDEMLAVGIFDATTTAEDRTTAESRLETTAALKYWNAWVGLWAQLGQVPVEDFVSGGQKVETLESPTADRVRLRFTEDLTGAALAEALGQSAAEGGDPTLYENVRRLKVVEAVTDPATLRPDSASYRFDVTGEIDNEPQSVHEVHAVEFNWTTAQGCGLN